MHVVETAMAVVQKRRLSTCQSSITEFCIYLKALKLTNPEGSDLLLA